MSTGATASPLPAAAGAQQPLAVAGVLVRRDSAGRFFLNDLHRAAGGEAKDKPVQFLRLASTAALIDELQAEVDNHSAYKSTHRIPQCLDVVFKPGDDQVGAPLLLIAQWSEWHYRSSATFQHLCVCCADRLRRNIQCSSELGGDGCRHWPERSSPLINLRR